MSENGGTAPPRPRPRSLVLGNGEFHNLNLDRKNPVLPPLPPPPPPPRNHSLESEDSTSLNNILDALNDPEHSEGSGSEGEDVLTDLPLKWSDVDRDAAATRNGVLDHPEEPNTGEDCRRETKLSPNASQVGLSITAI